MIDRGVVTPRHRDLVCQLKVLSVLISAGPASVSQAQTVPDANERGVQQAEEIVVSARVDQLEREPDMARFAALMTRSNLHRD
jgi:hypothetical protein